MTKTVVLYTAELDDSQPATRDCGLSVAPGPTVIAWVGSRADAVQLDLSPADACQTALDLLRHALHADYSVAMDDAVQRAIFMMALAGDIARDKRRNDRPDDPPRGVHAH